MEMLKGPSQEGLKFEASIGYIARLCPLRANKKKSGGQGPRRVPKAASCQLRPSPASLLTSIPCRELLCPWQHHSSHPARRPLPGALRLYPAGVLSGHTCAQGQPGPLAAAPPACRVPARGQSQARSGVWTVSLGWRLQGSAPTQTAHPPQIYPHGIPEDQLHLITSLVYLYSLAEIGQWNITSGDTVMLLLASDAALENQTEVRMVRAGNGAEAGWSGLPRPTNAGPASRRFYRSSWTITARLLVPFWWPSGAPVSAG